MDSQDTQFLLKYQEGNRDYTWESEFEDEPKTGDDDPGRQRGGGKTFTNNRSRGNRGRYNFNYGNKRGRGRFRGASQQYQDSWDQDDYNGSNSKNDMSQHPHQSNQQRW